MELVVSFLLAFGTFVIAYVVARVGFHGRDILKDSFWNEKKEMISAFPSVSHVHLNQLGNRARVVSDSYDDVESLFTDFDRGIRECRSAIESAERFHNSIRMLAIGLVLSFIYILFCYSASRLGSSILNITAWQFLTVWAVFFAGVMIYPNLRRQELIEEISKRHSKVLAVEEFQPVADKLDNGRST